MGICGIYRSARYHQHVLLYELLRRTEEWFGKMCEPVSRLNASSMVANARNARLEHTMNCLSCDHIGKGEAL